MEAIKKFKEQVSKIAHQLEETKKAIRQTRSLINTLSTTPLPRADVPETLAIMVDVAAARYLEFLTSEVGIAETLGADITDLPYRIEEKTPLSGLFMDRSGWDDEMDRPSGGPLMRPDALCYFFGDIIKQKLASAALAMEPDADDPARIATPYAKRLADIKAAETQLKALQLQEEELEAALEEARQAFESLDGI